MQHKVSIKLIVHSLFWIFYIVVLFIFDPPFYRDLNINWYDKIELNLLLLVLGMVYVNDQFLLPYFFKQKAYLTYTLIAISVIILSTTLYCIITDCDVSLFACYSNNIWIIALPVVFLSFIWLGLEFFEKQKELEKAHSDKVELELKFLKAQINPHVLFNSLNTIYAKAVKENDEIAELILMLSENLKYVLNQSQDKLVDLEKDIGFIENYLKFQELRTQGINNIIYHKEIDSYNYSIAPLILIDIIENAFKYSVYKDNDLCDIEIDIQIEKGNLQFTCKNEFDDTTQKKKKSETKIGIQNLKQRLQLIYMDKYDLNIENDRGVFIVELNIDLK